MSDAQKKLSPIRFGYIERSFMSEQHQHFQDLVLLDLRTAAIKPDSISCKCTLCRGVIANKQLELWEITRAEKMLNKRVYTHLYGILLDEARKQKKITKAEYDLMMNDDPGPVGFVFCRKCKDRVYIFCHKTPVKVKCNKCEIFFQVDKVFLDL